MRASPHMPPSFLPNNTSVLIKVKYSDYYFEKKNNHQIN